MSGGNEGYSLNMAIDFDGKDLNFADTIPFKRDILNKSTGIIAKAIKDASNSDLRLIYSISRTDGVLHLFMYYPEIGLNEKDLNTVKTSVIDSLSSYNAKIANITEDQKGEKIYELERKNNNTRIIPTPIDEYEYSETAPLFYLENIYDDDEAKSSTTSSFKSSESISTTSSGRIPSSLFVNYIKGSQIGDPEEYIKKDSYLIELLSIASESGFSRDSDMELISSVIYTIFGESPQGIESYNNYSDSVGNKTIIYKNYKNIGILSLIELLLSLDVSSNSYSNYLGNIINGLIDIHNTFNQFFIGTIFHRFYYHVFLYDEMKSRWFSFANGVWIEDLQHLTMIRYIDGNIKNMFEHYLLALKNETDLSEKDESKLKQLGKLLTKINSSGFKKEVIESLKPRMVVPKISLKFNTKHNTFYVNNGALEFDESSKKIIFRPHMREDYSTMKSQINYNEFYTLEHPDVQFVINYYKQLFPDEATRLSRLRWVGSGIFRGNHHNKSYSECFGTHNNSKSVETGIIDACFGPFSVQMKIAQLTTKPKDANSTDMGIANMIGKSWARYSEPARGDIIQNTTFIKSVSGNDILAYRMIFGAEQNSIISSKIEITSNFILPKDPGDVALDGRTIYFPYESLWSDHAPVDEEDQIKNNHYRKDTNFISKANEKLEAFLWYYVYHAQLWFADNKNLRISEKMKEFADKCKKKSDFYTPYLETYYQKADDGKIKYNDFIASANAILSKNKYKDIYSSDVLERKLGEWLGKNDYITLEKNQKYIIGIKRVSFEDEDEQ